MNLIGLTLHNALLTLIGPGARWVGVRYWGSQRDQGQSSSAIIFARRQSTSSFS